MSLLISAFLGLLAGLILNLMPCIIPIISIKLLSFSKLESLKRARNLAIFTILGILFFMMLLAIVFLILKSFSSFTYWGVQLQSSGFVLILIFILILFVLVLNDKITINIPHFLQKVGGGESSSDLLNGFVSGFFIVVFSASCSGPIIGTAVSLAFSAQDFYTLPIVLFFMGVGLSAPYMLFIAFPQIAYKIKSSVRFSRFAKLLTFVMMLITIAFLMFVLQSQTGLLIAVIAFILVLIFVFVVYKFPTIKVILASIVLLALSSNIKFEKLIAKDELMYENFEESKIDHFINSGLTVLIKLEASWCMTCRGNDLLAFNTKEVIEYVKENHVVFMKGDITVKNPKLEAFMRRFNVYGAPFTVIFSHKYPQGKLLPLVLTSTILIDALNDAKD